LDARGGSALRVRDAAKADVAGGGVDRSGLAGRRPVAKAVARGAEVRATLDHPPGDLSAGAAEVITGVRRVGGRVDWRRAARRCLDNARSIMTVCSKQIVPFRRALCRVGVARTRSASSSGSGSEDDKPEASLEPIRYEAIDMHGPSVGGGTIRRPPRRQLKITAWAVSTAAGP
jgi:hypothetical protein